MFPGMHASDEMRAAAAAYRARALPSDSAVADLLEGAARKAAAREGMWQLAGYTAQAQTNSPNAGGAMNSPSPGHYAQTPSDRNPGRRALNRINDLNRDERQPPPSSLPASSGAPTNRP